MPTVDDGPPLGLAAVVEVCDVGWLTGHFHGDPTALGGPVEQPVLDVSDEHSVGVVIGLFALFQHASARRGRVCR